MLITLAEWKAGFGNPADDADPDGDGWSVLEEFTMGGSLIAPDQLGAQGSADVANQLISVSVALRAGAPVKGTLESSSNLATWTADPNAVFISSDRLTATTDEFTMTAPMTGEKRFYRYVFELVN